MFQKIEDIIKNEKREKHGVEGMIIGSIIIPLIHFNNYDLYLYGGGSWVDALIIYLKEYNVRVKAIIDADESKKGMVASCGVNYIPLYEIDRINNPEKAFVIITPISLTGMEYNDIVNRFYDCGIKKIWHLGEEDKNRIIGNSWTGFESIRYYREHMEDLKKTYKLLEDDTSRDVMTEYIRTRVEIGIYALENIDGKNKYWFGREGEELYTHLDDEVWLNVGANIGDSVFLYFDNSLNAKAVYSFEADVATYKQLLFNIQLLPEKYKNVVHAYNLLVGEKTEFEEYIRDKVTLVNADIEGAEIYLLKAIRKIIVNDRPVLAICVYHRPDDLVQIPQYISKIVDGYHFFLRKYEGYELNSNRAGELVLYAVPDERISMV